MDGGVRGRSAHTEEEQTMESKCWSDKCRMHGCSLLVTSVLSVKWKVTSLAETEDGEERVDE